VLPDRSHHRGVALTYRSLRLPLALVGVALVSVPWFLALRALIVATPVHPPATTTPLAIIWADRVFSSRTDLAGWLKSRGAAYAHWAVRHPHARDTLEGVHPVAQGVPTVGHTVSTAEQSPPPSPVRASATHHARTASGGGDSNGLLRGGLLVLALLLGLIAFAPRKVLARQPFAIADGDQVRWIAAASALAVSVGVFLSYS